MIREMIFIKIFFWFYKIFINYFYASCNNFIKIFFGLLKIFY